MLGTTTHQWFITVSQVWYSDIAPGGDCTPSGDLIALPPGKFERILNVYKDHRGIIADVLTNDYPTGKVIDWDALKQSVEAEWGRRHGSWLWSDRMYSEDAPIAYLAQREWDGRVWFSWVPRACCEFREVNLAEV